MEQTKVCSKVCSKICVNYYCPFLCSHFYGVIFLLKNPFMTNTVINQF